MNEATPEKICEDLGFHREYTNFTHLSNTIIHFGVNESHKIGEHIKDFNASKVLIVTDNGILEAGHLDPVVNSLKNCRPQSDPLQQPANEDHRFHPTRHLLLGWTFLL